MLRALLLLAVFIAPLAGCAKAEEASVREVPYRHWESNSVESNGVRIHYWRTGGENKPVIIMSHGITDYGLSWASLASRFEDEFDIIMVDARGHGFSEKPAGPYDLDTHVEDLVGLVEALEITKPILIGHSMGGSIVAQTAAKYPDLPAAVIMEDPPMEESLERLGEDIIPDWRAMLVRNSTTPKADLMEEARTKYHPGWPDYEYDHWAESKHLVLPAVLDIVHGDGFGNPREIFAEIQAPTLILKAEADEESHRKRHLEAAAQLPNGKLIHIEDAGHLIRLDKPERTEQEIRDFLDGQ